MIEKERREGMDKVYRDLGYLIGRTDSLHIKMDDMTEDVKNNKENITKVKERLDKYRYLTAGGGIVLSALGFVVFKWDAFVSFINGSSQ